jgi:hypothetical protein
MLSRLFATEPSLRITSPLDGTTVHPGESLTLTVDVSPPEGTFQFVIIGAPSPIGFSKQVLSEPPYRFTIQIPYGIRPDRYPITAGGITMSSKQLVSSNEVTLKVERSDLPISIQVYPTIADFTTKEKRYLQITGTYKDNTTADLTESSTVRYVSSAPTVAAVNAQGIVIPIAPGSGTITVTCGTLHVDVPVRVRGAQ